MLSAAFFINESIVFYQFFVHFFLHLLLWLGKMVGSLSLRSKNSSVVMPPITRSRLPGGVPTRVVRRTTDGGRKTMSSLSSRKAPSLISRASDGLQRAACLRRRCPVGAGETSCMACIPQAAASCVYSRLTKQRNAPWSHAECRPPRRLIAAADCYCIMCDTVQT
jgi:hypothetical protein